MATEDIQVLDGHIVVERPGQKENVDVAVSDVDSVTFTGSGTDGSKPGALVLHTKDNGDVVIRVDDEDAADVITEVYALLKPAPKAQTAPADKTPVAKRN